MCCMLMGTLLVKEVKVCVCVCACLEVSLLKVTSSSLFLISSGTDTGEQLLTAGAAGKSSPDLKAVRKRRKG